MLLYRQDELSVLEKDLLTLDSNDATHRPLAHHSRRHDEQNDVDPVHSRKMMRRKIDDKLKEYGKNIYFSSLASESTLV